MRVETMSDTGLPLEISDTDACLPRCDPAAAGRIYQLLDLFSRLAEREGIAFWLTEGSFLGAIRHKGMIPWDDDADLQFMRGDEARVWALRGEFERHGCRMTKWWGGYKVFFTDGSPVPRHKHLHPFIDLFPTKRTWRGRLVYARLIARIEWRKVYYLEQDVFPLVRRPFGPLTLPCPNSHEGYFLRNYGPDWNDLAYLSFDHRNERKVEKVKVRLTDRSPARFVLREGVTLPAAQPARPPHDA